MILIIDNYDSFTYNLLQYLREMVTDDVRVVRNDAITVEEAVLLRPQALVVSSGAGYPQDAGVSIEMVRALAGKAPILGVSLGHLIIGVAFGANVRPGRSVMHGKTSQVTAGNEGIFRGLGGRPFKAMRYDSLVLDTEEMPACLEITATAESGEVMAIQHGEFPVYGAQFHPESIMTPVGKRIIRNFVKTFTP